MKTFCFVLLLSVASIAVEASDIPQFEISGYYGGEKRLLLDDFGGDYDGKLFGASFSAHLGGDLWVEGAVERGMATWEERSDGGPNNWEAIRISRMTETIGIVVLQKRWTQSRYSLFVGGGFAFGDRNYDVEESSTIYYLGDTPLIQENKYTTPRDAGGYVLQTGVIFFVTSHLFVRGQIEMHLISPSVRSGIGFRF